MSKKKINVIKPTLRHKKRYVCLEFVDPLIPLSKQKIYFSLSSAFQKTHGIFKELETNITVMEYSSESNKALIRVNKTNLSLFLGSLFFVKQECGRLKVGSISSTIKRNKI